MSATAEQTPSCVAEDVREARRAAGLTQADLAEQAGVSLTSVRRLERGWEPQGRSHVERIVRQTLTELAG